MLDPTIMMQAQKGDSQAFQQIVEAYDAIAWRTARVLLSDPSMIEDVLQDAWIDVWRGLPQLQHPQAFRSWLLTIVANRCRALVRRPLLVTIPLESSPAIDLASEDNEDTLDKITRLETATDLRLALEVLPVEQRRVLQLRYFADLELSEIALVLAVPIGTIKSRLNRALHTLRTSLPLKKENHVL